MLRFSILLFVFVLTPFFVKAQSSPTPAIINVLVTDTSGAPVSNYQVLIRPNGSYQYGEYVFSTNSNGFIKDTVLIHPSVLNPQHWDMWYYALDSSYAGVGEYVVSTGGPIQPPYTSLDTVHLKVQKALRGTDNCSGYSVHTVPKINDPLFVYFKNDLNRLKTGITWDFGDGDTGHAPHTWHRYDTAGTYYFCHYTDSCGPVCDSVRVPTNAPTCVLTPSYHLSNAGHQGAHVSFNAHYQGPIDSVEWTLSTGHSASIATPAFILPNGRHQYCLSINDCPVFCDSISINLSCASSFAVDTAASTASNLVIFNTIHVPAGHTAHFMWYFGDGDSSAVPYPTHTYPTHGAYRVCLRVNEVDAMGHIVCTSTYCDTIGLDAQGNVYKSAAGFTLNVLDPSVGQSENLPTSSLLILYPNPTQGRLILKGTDLNEIRQVEIYNLSGKMVFALKDEGSHQLALNVQELPGGLYFMQVETAKGKERLKFIRQ